MVGVVQELVYPPAVITHGGEVVGSVVARGFVLRLQVRDLDDTPGCPVDRGAELWYAEHGHDARVQRSGRQHDLVGATPNSDTGAFADYDTLGVDASALYIGVNVFDSSGTSFLGSS